MPVIRRGLLISICLATAGANALAQQPGPEPILPGSTPSTTLPDVPPPNPADSLLDEIDLPPSEMLRETPQSTTGSPILDQPFRTGPAFKRRPDSIEERVRFRKVKTIAMKDPEVAEAFAAIDLAKTDPVKMERRYRYYHLLFARMRRIDRGLALLPQVEAETYVRLKGTIIPAENRAVIRRREE